MKAPSAAVLFAAKVRMLELVALLGLKVAVTPLGKPVADKFTALLNPLCLFTVIVLLALFPLATVSVAGEAARLKSGCGADALTVSVREVV